MRALDFQLLGPFTVTANGDDLTPRRPKQRILLALLALRPNEVVSTDDLIEAVWGDRPPATAQTALHGHVSQLRKLVGAQTIETRAPGYVLCVDEPAIDIGRFERLLAAARSSGDAAARAEQLRHALSLFRGEPLFDFRYDAFARDAVQRLEELRLTASEELMAAELDLGRHEAALPELERLVTAHPLRERLRAQLMLALYRAGRQAEALHVYQEGRRVLVEELGIDPGPALQELERKILEQDASLDLASRQPVTTPGVRRERRLITALLCDVVSFAPGGEEPDPEDLSAALDPYLDRVSSEIERFGGTVERRIGDVVLGVFGALAHEDDPERAVRAALAIRDALHEELQLRLGVQSGEALVLFGPDGLAARGSVVNAVARIHGSAAPNAVLVGDATYAATKHRFSYRSVEGPPELPLWEVRGLAPADVPSGPTASFVGRRRELDQLEGALARALAERSLQLVTIVGVPGIGKTRLIRELFQRVEAEPETLTWLQGRSLPYGEGVTLWALGEIVKAHAGVFEGDSAEGVEEKLRLSVAEAVGERREADWVHRHLCALVGLGGDAERGEAFAAWRLFLESVAESEPLVLVFEDLHWADEGLLDFIDELVDRTTGVPLLVVCTTRPELFEKRPDWAGGKRNALTISLAPLSHDETETLMGALLPTMQVAPPLIERVAGNPLFAEEYARLALEEGGSADLPLPETLQALIAARLDLLPPDEKAVIRDAAVIGETLWLGAVAAVARREREVVESLVDSLDRKEYLRRHRSSAMEGDREYAFQHALVREVAYAQIPRDERAERHQLVAEWIDSLGRRDDHAEMLAHHYVQALELARAARREPGDLEQIAAKALRGAGDRAFSLATFTTAARFYESALELWPEDDPEHPELVLRYARARRDDPEFDVAALDRAAERLRAAGQVEEAAETHAALGFIWSSRGNRDNCFEHVTRAAALLEDRPPTRAKTYVLASLARWATLADERDDAIRFGEEALRMAEALGLEELQASALTSVATTRMQHGDLGGLEDYERAIEIARAANSPEAYRATVNRAATVWSYGDLTRAEELHNEFRREAERFGLKAHLRGEFAERATLFFALGRWDEAKEIADRSLAESAAGTPTARDQSCYEVRARLKLGRGDVDGALADAASALRAGRAIQDPQSLWPATSLQARVFLHVGRLEEAEALFDELLEAWAEHGLWGNVWFAAIDAAWLSIDFGREHDLLALTEREERLTRWFEAAQALARHDLVGGADILREIPSPSDEAYVRLRAVEDLGRNDQLARCLELSRSLGATAYLERANRASGW